ncbi:MAG: gephyrin-like molybdotransferase Glp [Cyanobacteria bacterium P01_D01_bin.73]
MLSVAEAEARILALCVPFSGGDREEIPITEGRSRILAKAVLAARDVPHWDNSAMDGFAVRSRDCQESGAELKVIDEVPAGENPGEALQAGQAARIFTGGVLPRGADAVVMQEETEVEDSAVAKSVVIKTAVKSGQFVRRRGDYCRAGASILAAGTRLGPAELAIAAANQTAQLSVLRRPKVAILSTGNELVSVDQPLQPGQIVDSNRYALIAFVEQMGAIPMPLGIVGDRREDVTAAIRQAISEADVVLSTGGVSVGDYDYVEAVLEELGGAIAVRKVAVKPGKPLTVAQFSAGKLRHLGLDSQGRDRPVVYFGLPGNPVSALVGCWRFVAPALRTISGRSPDGIAPQFVMATTRSTLRGAGTRDNYLWGRLGLDTESDQGGFSFQGATGHHNSANLINLAGTTGLAIVPAGTKTIQAGESVQVMLIQELG